MKYRIGNTIKMLPLEKLKLINNWNMFVSVKCLERMAGKEFIISTIEEEIRIGIHYHPYNIDRNTINYDTRFNDHFIDDKPKNMRELIE